MPEFTDRQYLGFASHIQTAAKYGVDLPPLESWHWYIRWEDEVRPGRGNDISAVFTDGEKLVHIILDVYGNGDISIADIEWGHSSHEEEPCDECNELGLDVDDSITDEEVAKANEWLKDIPGYKEARAKQLCGDWPAPCNCDNPVTHGGH